MIYDPNDVNIAMDGHGILYYRRPEGSVPEWEPLQIIDFRGEFRRPEW